MNEWHLTEVVLQGCGVMASSGGWSLAEWLPSVRFISAKDHPLDEASDRRPSIRPSTLPLIADAPSVCLKADSKGNHGLKASATGWAL